MKLYLRQSDFRPAMQYMVSDANQHNTENEFKKIKD